VKKRIGVALVLAILLAVSTYAQTDFFDIVKTGTPQSVQAVIDNGADVNARATVDPFGIGGQTPIFHAVTQFGDWGLAVAQLLSQSLLRLSVLEEPGYYPRRDRP